MNRTTPGNGVFWYGTGQQIAPSAAIESPTLCLIEPGVIEDGEACAISDGMLRPAPEEKSKVLVASAHLRVGTSANLQLNIRGRISDDAPWATLLTIAVGPEKLETISTKHITPQMQVQLVNNYGGGAYTVDYHAYFTDGGT